MISRLPIYFSKSKFFEYINLAVQANVQGKCSYSVIIQKKLRKKLAKEISKFPTNVIIAFMYIAMCININIVLI